MANLELFGTAACPYTREMREWLEWQGREFTEFDVDLDASARRRLRELTSPPHAVPVLVEDGKIHQVGWRGQSCIISIK